MSPRLSGLAGRCVGYKTGTRSASLGERVVQFAAQGAALDESGTREFSDGLATCIELLNFMLLCFFSLVGLVWTMLLLEVVLAYYRAVFETERSIKVKSLELTTMELLDSKFQSSLPLL